jgi:hypothetical protein
VGENLASDIPPSTVEPDVYVVPTETTFSMKSLIKERKAAGLDKIPCKLLRISAEIVAESLTQIFNKTISTSIFPTDWKLARVTPIFKKSKKDDMNNYRPITVISVAERFLKSLLLSSCTSI